MLITTPNAQNGASVGLTAGQRGRFKGTTERNVMPEPRYCNPLETVNTYSEYPGDPVPFYDYVKGYFTSFADWGAVRRKAPMNDNDPYRPEPGTLGCLLTGCVIFLAIAIATGAGSMFLHWMFYGK